MSGSPESLVFLRDSVAFSAITGGAPWSRRTRDSSCRACVKACLSSLSCVECATHARHTPRSPPHEAQRVKNVHGKAPPRLGRTRSRRVSAGLSRDGCSIILHSTLGDVFAPANPRTPAHRLSRVPVPANPANVCAFAPRLPRPPDSSCARRGPARLLRRRFLGALLLEHPQPRLPRVLHLPAGTQCDAHYTLRVACVQLTAEYSGCSVDTMAHSRVQSQAAGQHRARIPHLEQPP